MYCDATEGGLVAVALVASGSGPGWTYHACRTCRIGERLVPLACHPSDSWGGVHQWPEAVPRDLVARIADLDSTRELRPITDRLFPAAVITRGRFTPEHRRELAQSVVSAALTDLWTAAGSTPGTTP